MPERHETKGSSRRTWAAQGPKDAHIHPQIHGHPFTRSVGYSGRVTQISAPRSQIRFGKVYASGRYGTIAPKHHYQRQILIACCVRDRDALRVEQTPQAVRQCPMPVHTQGALRGGPMTETSPLPNTGRTQLTPSSLPSLYTPIAGHAANKMHPQLGVFLEQP